MKKIEKNLPLIILLFFAFLASWPLIKPGFIPTHDGEYHLIRFWQFDKNIRSGLLFPRWAPDLDQGFGVPLFSFFYPLPNYAAEIFLLLGSSLTNAFKLSQALAFILSGLFFYLWLKQSFKKWPSLLGAIFYLFAPYHFLDLYVRGSVGEVWALTWLPAILWSSQQLIKTNKIKYLILTAIFLALLILSHNLLSLLFMIFIISYLTLLIINQSPQKRLITIRYFLITVFLGIGLTCYFWLPAIAERKYVKGLEFINFADHFPSLFQLIFPSWGTGFSVPGILDEMSFQIGLDHLLVVIPCLFFILKRQTKPLLTFFLSWFFILVFLSLEISLPIWKIIPFLKYFQYPWRLNSLIIVTTSFLAGWIAHHFKKKSLVLLMIVLAVVINWRYSRPVIYSPREDAFYLENPDWIEGTATLGNSFKTAWAKEHQAYQEKLEILEGEALIKENFIKPTTYSFLIEAKEETKLRVNTNYFPGWQVLVDKQKEKIFREPDGAFGFALPQGKHQVKITLQETTLRLLANLISLFSLLVLVGKVIKYHYENRY